MANILKLGKKPATYDRRDLQFEHYIDRTKLPAPPKQFGHELVIPTGKWGMLGNDRVGDCVFAGGGHETLLWNAEGGTPVSITDDNAISDYSAVTGYDPNVPGSDQGTDVRAVMAYRQKIGLVDAAGKRHLIGAYLALEPGNIQHLYEALYLFSAVGIGIKFPASAMDQFNQGKPWSVVHGKQTIEGGHYVSLVANRSNLVCVTWAQLQQMTLQFYKKYADEAWAIFSPEFLASGKSPEGFDLMALQADLRAL